MKKKQNLAKKSKETKSTRARKLYPIGLAIVLFLAVGNLLGLCMLLLPEISFLDEGTTCMGAWRITQGQVPYRDFFSVTTPLSFYILAAAYKLVGVSFIAGRLLGIVFGLLLLLLTYLIAKRLFKEQIFLLYPMSALIMAGVGVWCFPSHHWLVDLLQLASILAMLKSANQNSGSWASAAGGLAALSVFALQDQGAFFFLATALVALPVLAAEKRARLALCWLATFGIAGLCLGVYLMLSCSIDTLWEALVAFPLANYKGADVNYFTLPMLLKELAKPFLPANLANAPALNLSTGLCWMFLLVNPVAALALMGWRFAKERQARLEVAILAAGVLAFAATFLRRPGVINLYWASAPAAIATGYGLAWLAGSSRYPWAKKWCYAALALATLSFALHGAVRQYDMLAGARTESVYTPAGAIKMLKSDSRSFSELVGAISNTVPEGDPLVTLGGFPMINFLARRHNPTRYDLIMRTSYTTPEQGAQIVESIEGTRSAWCVFLKYPLGDAPVEKYVNERFEPAWQNGDFVLAKKRAQ